MQALGAELAESLNLPALLTLSGELGAGKSVLARSIIEAFGYRGLVKSPTYSLIETYEADGCRMAHMDLYRLNDPDELHYLGFDDVLIQNDVVLIEWPEQGAGYLPEPELAIRIDYDEVSGRVVTIVASPKASSNTLHKTTLKTIR